VGKEKKLAKYSNAESRSVIARDLGLLYKKRSGNGISELEHDDGRSPIAFERHRRISAVTRALERR
jgi:hypothetical protein